jgi:hypothetical protein
MVNPTSLLFGGRPTARKADEMRGNGTLEKAKAVPVMGRTGVATLLHRASGPTSSRVVRYEKACRASIRGKANERGFIHVCVLWHVVSGGCKPVS